MRLIPHTFSAALLAFVVCLFGSLSAQAQLTIDLGPDRVLCAGESSSAGSFEFRLNPLINDGSLDIPVSWSATGPGSVTFSPTGGGQVTDARFSTRGSYTVRAEVTLGEQTARDEVQIHATLGSSVHWRLDQLTGRGVPDSSIISADGSPIGPHAGTWGGSDESWLAAEGKYGGALRIGQPGRSLRLDRDFQVGQSAPFSVGLWFKSESLQDGALIDMMPNAGEGTGWSLLLQRDGSVALAIGNETFFETISTPDCYTPGEWTHVAFTLRKSTTHAGATLAEIYTLRERDEPIDDADLFTSLPLPDILACFENTQIEKTDVHIHLGEPNDAHTLALADPVVFDDVRMYAHRISAEEVQDSRLRRAPWRISLFQPRFAFPWIVGQLRTLDPNLCDHFQYEIVDQPGTDASAFTIISDRLLSTTEEFVATPGRTYCIVVRSTDDVGLSVETRFCFVLARKNTPVDPPPNPPDISIDPNPGETGSNTGGGGVFVPVAPPVTITNPTVTFVLPSAEILPPPHGAISPLTNLLRHYTGDGGTTVATVEITDIPESPYEGGFTVEFLAGNGDDDNGSFELVIDKESGAIHLKLREGVLVNQETGFRIRLAVVDNTGARFGQSFEIHGLVLLLNEFSPTNTGELVDDLGNNPDWIELHNPGPNAIDLSLWSLTDEAQFPAKWQFPEGARIEAGGYEVVFASGRDTETEVSGFYHTGFKLSRDRCEYLGVYAPDRVQFSEYQHTPEVPDSVSYGLLDGVGQFMAKTPLGSNRLPFPSVPSGIGEPVIDFQSSYFSGTVLPSILVPASEPEGTVARFTTDGSEPDMDSPVAAGAITLSGTSQIIRARLYRPDGGEGPVVTRSYLNREAIFSQPDMNQELGIDFASLVVAFDELPMISIAGDPVWLLGEDGLMNPDVGREARKVSIECILPAGQPHTGAFSTTVGLRLNGRRGVTESPKQSFRLQFRSRFGDGTLRAKIFGENGPERFDNLVLRGGFNNNITHPEVDQRERSLGIRDRFARDTHRAMGLESARGRFVHLFLNAQYWGVYDLAELPDDRFASRESCFDDRDYDVIDAGEEADGGLRAQEGWRELEDLIANLGALDPQEIASFRRLVDEENLADFIVLHAFLGSSELGLFSQNNAEQNNWFASRLAGESKGFGFHLWDSERTLEEGDANYFTMPNRTRLLDFFVADTELRLLMADRLFRHTTEGGSLSVQVARERFDPLATRYINSLPAERARWGDKVDPSMGLGISQWISERDRVVQSFFPDRPETVIAQFRAAGLYPDLDPPEFAIATGFQSIGIPLSFGETGDTSQIYFTIDGSDPRSPGGGTSASAILSSSPFPLAGSVTVSARRLLDGDWSALTTGDFAFGYADIEPGALRVTEIMSQALGTDDRNYIEFYNAGDTPIALGGLVLDGDVDFNFSDASFGFLQPGAYMLIVEDLPEFIAHYGVGLPVAGQYDKSLNEALGKKIEVQTLGGMQLLRFVPETGSPWPDPLSRGGFSMVPDLIETMLTAPNYENPELWRLGSARNGSPGRLDPPIDLSFEGVVFNEIRSHHPSFSDETLPNAIELRNTTSTPKDISGWLLTDRRDFTMTYQIPQGTVIPPQGLLVLHEDDDGDTGTLPPAEFFGSVVRLSGVGRVLLAPVDGGGNPLGQYILSEYEAAPFEATRSRVVDSTGEEQFVITDDTIGFPNLPPHTERLVIQEIWLTSSNNSFIELVNNSDQPLVLRDYPFKLGANSPDSLVDVFGDVTIPPHGLMVAIRGGDPQEFRTDHNIPPGIPVGVSEEFQSDNFRIMEIRPRLLFRTNEHLYPSDDRWPGGFRNGSRSIVRESLSNLANDPGSWRLSCVAHGTPGRGPVLSFEEAMAAVLPGASSSLIAPDADPDGDGILNFLEFAFALNASVPDGSPVRISGDGDGLHLNLTFRRPYETFGGISYHVERSTDLQRWERLPISSYTIHDTPLADGNLETIFRVPFSGDAEHFRIRVEM